MPLALMVLSGLCGACATQPVMRPARHVVLSEVHRARGASWIPSEAEIEALESDLGALWARPDGRMSRKTKLKLSDYVVRYRGVESDGRRFIVGEGLHTSMGHLERFLKEERGSGWLSIGGGWDFVFEMRYEVAPKRVITVNFGAAL